MADVIHFPASFETSAAGGILARVSNAIANYKLYRRTIGELQSLNNRELQDLGLSRFSIRQVAYDAVYGA